MLTTTRFQPELLCPAGDFDAMRAAVANGANAVYFGLPAFNARHRATNFTLESLPETMRYLHRRNVKGFVTFNVLIFSDELPQAVEYIQTMAAAGVDAVIVQDLGLCRLIKSVAPKVEIHSSTQMTITEPRGVLFAKSLGVERVVLGREMSVAEIAKVTAAVPEMPVEVFVHGALCVAYSGQCLTSESFGGRSANRGQCAQACRMPYELIVDGVKRELPEVIKYLVSPTDLGGWAMIDDLVKANVASFKIEGRLKGANYVAQTAQVYRAAIDAAARGEQWAADDEQVKSLTLVYSRGFSPGFLEGVNHQRLVPGRFPKARGLRIGSFVEATPRGFVLEIEQDWTGSNELPLKPGDGVVFDEGHPEEDEPFGQVYKVQTWRDHSKRNRRLMHIEVGNREARSSEVDLGAIVWKTSDPALNKQLVAAYEVDRVVHRVPIDLVLHTHVGDHARLVATDGTHSVEAEFPQTLQPGLKFPITADRARRQLDRFRDTPFELRELTLDANSGPMVPNSILADLRRRVTDQLVEARHLATVVDVRSNDELVGLRSAVAGASRSCMSETPMLRNEMHVLARTLDQVDTLLALPEEVRPHSVYCDFEDVRRYRLAVEKCRAAKMPIALATIRIIKPGEEGWLNQVLLSEPDAVIVRNLAGIGFFRERAPHLPLIGDFSLNIANELTAQILREANLVRAVPSYDLSWNQMAAMISRFDPSWFECVVHQHMPMFHMEHCTFCFSLSTGKDFRDCGRPCETHKVDLRDHLGNAHPLLADAGCRNTMFNAQAQSGADYVPRMLAAGIRHFRIELLRETGPDVEAIVSSYWDVIRGVQKPRDARRSLNVLSQLGVTGTLDRE